jgi:5-(carboxyamino)imidazole ribonucleotide mutase
MKIAILMGSDSDFPVIEKGIQILRDFGVDFELRVMSAHRTPDIASEFAKNAEKNGFEVIIAIAGKAAHLGGVLAACTCLPVIGVPVKSTALEGMDALLSMVQMPPGIPVATVAINAGDNAALLAIQMLSIKYPELRAKFHDYKKQMEEKVIKTDKEIQKRL